MKGSRRQISQIGLFRHKNFEFDSSEKDSRCTFRGESEILLLVF